MGGDMSPSRLDMAAIQRYPSWLGRVNDFGPSLDPAMVLIGGGAEGIGGGSAGVGEGVAFN
jgi:hypothetical protein